MVQLVTSFPPSFLQAWLIGTDQIVEQYWVVSERYTSEPFCITFIFALLKCSYNFA